MSDFDSLPQPLRQFAGEEPDASDAALAEAGEDDLRSLIAALEAGERRAHLEALGEAPVPRSARKAARTAAYRLKSKGVSSDWHPRPRVSLKVDEHVGEVAATLAPGVAGNPFLMTVELGLAPGVFVVCAPGGRIESVRVLESMSRRRLRDAVKEDVTRGHATRPVVVGPDLAVRMLDAIRELHPGEEPEGWYRVEQWRKEAVRRGADPRRASAVSRLGEVSGEVTVSPERLFDEPRLGALVPPHGFWQRLDARLQEIVESPLEIDRATFDGRVDDAIEEEIDAWIGADDNRERMIRWLELDADVALHEGLEEEARVLVRAAADLRDTAREPHEVPMFRLSVRNLIDMEAAWETYQTHEAEPPEE